MLSITLSSADLADKIGSALNGVKRGEQWMCKCPAHADGNASLAVNGESGKLLLKCHAGCSFDDVRAKLESMALMPKAAARPDAGQRRLARR